MWQAHQKFFVINPNKNTPICTMADGVHDVSMSKNNFGSWIGVRMVGLS
ncbi:hypothetical protein [Moraxella sp.]|nr:hypothetical protein [Moraxella sp.]MDO4894472.1 hypothetical protein [Moraxella sp.]